MDIPALQRAANDRIVKPDAPIIDYNYVRLIAGMAKNDLLGFIQRNTTARQHYWVDYANTGVRKPTYLELKEVKKLLKPQLTNVKISCETVIFYCKGSRKPIPQWNRLSFTWK